jgi:hypothetical protein
MNSENANLIMNITVFIYISLYKFLLVPPPFFLRPTIFTQFLPLHIFSKKKSDNGITGFMLFINIFFSIFYSFFHHLFRD